MSTAMPWWPIFLYTFWIPARCSTVLAAAVLFAIQLRTTSLLLLLPRIHTYITRTFFRCGNLHVYLGLEGETERNDEIIMKRRQNGRIIDTQSVYIARDQTLHLASLREHRRNTHLDEMYSQPQTDERRRPLQVAANQATISMRLVAQPGNLNPESGARRHQTLFSYQRAISDNWDELQ